MISVIDSIHDILKSSPRQKAKDLAGLLGISRKEVNNILYSNPEVFTQNADFEWLIHHAVKEGDNAEPPSVAENRVPHYAKSSAIRIHGIDIVERLKNELGDFPNQKAKSLSEKLDEPRRLVSRTLHSYTDIYLQNEQYEWSLKPDYTGNAKAPDADSKEQEGTKSRTIQSPRKIFKELGKSTKQTVIEAKLDRNFLILAPPGTGKTYTLVERLVHSISEAKLTEKAGEILVLSFTRAAVREIRERIARAISDGAPNSLRYVRVQTFDAYASWLLSDGGYDVVGLTYDARIKLLANRLVEVNLRQATDRIARSRFLFIDEIQDLVGIRADMVFELVKRVLINRGSVTLLGDPHQSLNDYQLRDMQTGSAEFLEKIRIHLRDGLEEVELGDSRRYETSRMKLIASKAKEILDAGEGSASQKFGELLEVVPKVSLSQLSSQLEEKKVDAILCRSNAEVYQWSNWLKEHGNHCLVNAGAGGRPWPAWIGAVIMHYQAESITFRDLVKRSRSLPETDFSISEENLAEFLTKEKLLRGNLMNLKELASRLKYSSPAMEEDFDQDGLIVSTVHKAKGLEYNNVVVGEPAGGTITEDEVRVLYVAITRAKRSITVLPNIEKPFNVRVDKCRGGHKRFTENGTKYLQVIGMQDFDLETLFIDEAGGVDLLNLEKYLLCYQEGGNYLIRPESCNKENDHNYALYLNSKLGSVKLCAVDRKMKVTLDAMSFGNNFGELGVALDCGCAYQTIVHPLESPLLAKRLGPAGIMVFPLIEGFYRLSKAVGE